MFNRVTLDEWIVLALACVCTGGLIAARFDGLALVGLAACAIRGFSLCARPWTHFSE